MTHYQALRTLVRLRLFVRKTSVFRLSSRAKVIQGSSSSAKVKPLRGSSTVYRQLNNGQTPPQAAKATPSDIKTLNQTFGELDPVEGLEKLYETFEPRDVMITTSFGTKSILLIHLISRIQPEQKFYFVDTGFHFEETMAYKKRIEEMYGVQIETVQPAHAPHDLTAEEKWWTKHPKMCCAINKIAPLEPVIADHKVWVSSLMAYQTPHRSKLKIFVKQGDILKYQPLLNMPEAVFSQHLNKLELPLHPLICRGYGSIGCRYCTQKGNGRNGRWADRSKTECGLHVKYYN